MTEVNDKPLVWLYGEIKTPPFTPRVRDENKNWRINYRVDPDAILILDVFKKKSRKTPVEFIERCIVRLKKYDATA